MSAPDVNLDKQARRHRGPLYGIAIGLVVVLGLFAAYNLYVWEPAEDGVEQPAATAIPVN